MNARFVICRRADPNDLRRVQRSGSGGVLLFHFRELAEAYLRQIESFEGAGRLMVRQVEGRDYRKLRRRGYSFHEMGLIREHAD